MKRRLNGKAIALLCAALLILLSVFKVPRFLNLAKLRDLGYSEEAITAIYKKGIRGEILKNGYYSDYLNKKVVQDDFKKQYLRLYLVTDDLNEDSFTLYERLKALKGYTDDEMVSIFGSLKRDDMIKLCVFDKVDVAAFLEDAKDGSLSEDYLRPYEDIKEVADPTSIETFVSKKFSIGEYAPASLVPISSQNATPNQQLESRAFDAFNELCSAARSAGVPIYAVSSYKDYESLKANHDSYGGGREADAVATRGGHADAQLGLSVAVVASENESASLFHETGAYTWLLEHGHEYGWIQRYPADKEDVTGYGEQTNYFRYVGTELAEQIHKSGLSFDEFYMLYLYDPK